MESKAGEFIRLMESAEWSQAEAARRLQITPGAVSQICNGRTQPRAATLNLLKLMVYRGEQDSPGSTSSPVRLMPWEANLLKELRRLPRSQRDGLLVAFRQLIKSFLQKSKR